MVKGICQAEYLIFLNWCRCGLDKGIGGQSTEEPNGVGMEGDKAEILSMCPTVHFGERW